MREATGDLWNYLKVGAVICITTNGDVRVTTHGSICGLDNGGQQREVINVMGRGCAKEARDKFPGLDKRIGKRLKAFGNRCFRIPMGMTVGNDQSEWTLVTLPTKHHWREPSDPMLIAQSCDQLVELADKHNWTEVVMPRPGCGNGGLKWEDIKPLIEPMLDDRFVVVTK